MSPPDTRRGRPPSFDRAAALEAATRLFWENGYEGTSISDLTREMGIRPGSLYAAFGDKRSLFNEVVETYGRSPAGELVWAAMAREPTAYDAFRRVLIDAAAMYTDPETPAGNLLCSAVAADVDVATYMRDLRNADVATFEKRLTTAREDGELPASTDPARLASYFTTVLHGMSQRARDGATSAELTDTAELAMAAWPRS
ncbi:MULTISPECIES: TetR/AcrR family transcriptional regulator [unclassified Nocardioides]|uniref:TetR/AcrR family transcriptional regulator n=1 Tax=unclassified Nocardioides TaxID=2615069 RepID=UPI003014B949